jgi:phosphate transport system substrate-binding protein
VTFLKLLAAIAAIATISITSANTQEVVGSAAVTGAGSTFAYPIIARWSRGYQHWVAGGGEYRVAGSGLDDPPAGPILDYEPIGSLAGMMRIKDGRVDFAASDMPLPSSELEKLGLVQFPLVIGGAVVVVNIDNVRPGQIRLTGPLLADIYLGKIRRWSDPAIAAINPDLKLPEADIVLVHRSDGSGTTYNFANYLSKVSPEWREKVGFDLLVPWPGGLGAKGNSGVAETVARTKHSIGYVEFAQALQSRLSYATLKNQTGRFVEPSASSFQEAAQGADWSGSSDFNLLLTNSARPLAWPIAATVFCLMKRDPPHNRNQSVLNLLRWSLERGSDQARGLGYVPLPPILVAQVKSYWARALKPGT